MQNSLFLNKTLTLKVGDYHNLTSGIKTTILSRPYQPDEFYIILPQGDEIIKFKHFIKAIYNEPIIDKQSRKNILDLLDITDDYLDKIIQEHGFVSLLTVRVYTCLSENVLQGSAQLGLQEIEPIIIEKYHPILDDYNFEKLCNDPNYRLAPLTQLIPDLQNLALSDPRTDNFLALIQADQQEQPRPLQPIPDWITNQKIITLGKGKNPYEQGTDFEEIVRQALEYLGFTVDDDHKGGAGNLDFYISKPYPIIGECKSGNKVPGDTSTQLIRLGITKLGINCLSKCVKLIVAAGKPTTEVTKFAKQSNTCIMTPQTLQKLVALHAHYPGAINLWQLKKYLVAGAAEKEIDQYVQKIYQQISLRRSIVELVKTLQERTHQKYVSLDEIWGAYAGGNHQLRLDRSKLLSILIELSSPLIGCLGRYETKQRRFQDFYHCRDLPDIKETDLTPGAGAD